MESDLGIVIATKPSDPSKNREGSATRKFNPKGCATLTRLQDRGRSSFRGFRTFHEFPDNRKNREHCVQIRDAGAEGNTLRLSRASKPFISNGLP
jgi:hypothetical protein